ncbi:MAG TPA: SCO family protein [Rhodothermales bacterium]
MIDRPVQLVFAGAAILALALLSACTPSRTWDVRGRVVGFGDDSRTVFISHENIPGLMPAMTMPFTAADTAATRGVQHGDAVQFVLHVSRDSTWITDLRPLEPGAPPLVLEEELAPSAEDGSPLIAQGEQVPDVELVDHEGTPFRISDYRGRFVLVNFIYTRCPLPDFCPWMTRRFAELYTPLKRDHGDRISLLTVTLDPEYDTPEVLKAYRERHARSAADWRFATGDAEAVRTLASALGVSYTAVASEVIHSLVTALVDTSGALDAMWRGNEWPIGDVADRLHYLTDRQ